MAGKAARGALVILFPDGLFRWGVADCPIACKPQKAEQRLQQRPACAEQDKGDRRDQHHASEPSLLGPCADAERLIRQACRLFNGVEYGDQPGAASGKSCQESPGDAKGAQPEYPDLMAIVAANDRV